MSYIKTDIAELKFDGHHTLEIIMLENIELTILNVKQTFEKTKNLTSGKKVKVLLDLRGLQFTYVPSEVMDYMGKSAFNKYQQAVAIVIEGLGQKLLGNFYTKIVKPEVKTKVFTNKSDAINWLETLNEKEATPTL